MAPARAAMQLRGESSARSSANSKQVKRAGEVRRGADLRFLLQGVARREGLEPPTARSVARRSPSGHPLLVRLRCSAPHYLPLAARLSVLSPPIVVSFSGKVAVNLAFFVGEHQTLDMVLVWIIVSAERIARKGLALSGLIPLCTSSSVRV